MILLLMSERVRSLNRIEACLTLIVLMGGGHHATQNFVKSARVRTIIPTALIKHISLFDPTS